MLRYRVRFWINLLRILKNIWRRRKAEKNYISSKSSSVYLWDKQNNGKQTRTSALSVCRCHLAFQLPSVLYIWFSFWYFYCMTFMTVFHIIHHSGKRWHSSKCFVHSSHKIFYTQPVLPLHGLIRNNHFLCGGDSERMKPTYFLHHCRQI